MDEKESVHTVEGDRIGFETSEIERRTRGFGLFSIWQRLTELGSQIEVESEWGQGRRGNLITPLECSKYSARGN